MINVTKLGTDLFYREDNALDVVEQGRLIHE